MDSIYMSIYMARFMHDYIHFFLDTKTNKYNVAY
jgi:hypothetical protein